jgi:hypothetical protein
MTLKVGDIGQTPDKSGRGARKPSAPGAAVEVNPDPPDLESAVCDPIGHVYDAKKHVQSDQDRCYWRSEPECTRGETEDP